MAAVMSSTPDGMQVVGTKRGIRDYKGNTRPAASVRTCSACAYNLIMIEGLRAAALEACSPVSRLIVQMPAHVHFPGIPLHAPPQSSPEIPTNDVILTEWFAMFRAGILRIWQPLRLRHTWELCTCQPY
eukprot:scaffold282698_cov22-Tisochrysis_lutea.AAC.1